MSPTPRKSQHASLLRDVQDLLRSCAVDLYEQQPGGPELLTSPFSNLEKPESGLLVGAELDDADVPELVPVPGVELLAFTPRPDHMLQPLFDELNLAFFAGEIDVRVRWARRRSHRLLGRWIREKRKGGAPRNVIEINPLLADPRVPEYYIQFVIYHEILHEVHPPFWKDGRRHVHHARFRAEEKKFPLFREATGWERTHLASVLKLASQCGRG